MVPLMLLVGGYIIMLIVDAVGDCVVRITRFHQRLESKVRGGNGGLLCIRMRFCPRQDQDVKLGGGVWR